MGFNLETELENDIVFGYYSPGARIIEDEVMERYQVKRHSVRAAFNVLEVRGLLVRRPNRGVEVIKFTPDEIDELYEVRIILETSAAQRTVLPCSNDTIQELEAVAKQHAQAVREQDFRAVFALNKRFHEVQYACCGNPLLAELIAQHARSAQPIRVVKYDDEAHMENVIKQHYAIIEAMKGSSNEAYVKATKEHLPASADAFRRQAERSYRTQKNTA